MAATCDHQAATASSPFVESFEVPPLGCNCTIIGDRSTRDCIVVDPGGDSAKILAKIESKGFTLRRVLITHGHLDHVAAGQVLKEKTGCDILMHQDDLGLYERVADQCRDFRIAPPEKQLPRPDAFVTDGTVIQWSSSYKVECIHCPGHTPGSISYYFPECNLVCPGDTLFKGSVGRTSWYGIPSLEGTSDAQQLVGSIRYKLMSLPTDTRVVSGHGEHTTIGEESRYNPYIR